MIESLHLDWVGNVFIVIGLWNTGLKKRWAFLFSLVGEAAWIWWSLARTPRMWSLAAICVVFAALAGRNYILWGKPEEKKS